MAKDTGKVNIHGKEYETVASRVQKFRDQYKADEGWSIQTKIVTRDELMVVMKAYILKDDKVLATGHAEEIRTSSTINKTSALENCETSAIGRALASFGMAGTEFASADEVANAISHQNAPTSRTENSTKTYNIPAAKPSIPKLQMLKGQIRAELHKQGIADEDSHEFIKIEYGYDGITTQEQATEVLEKLRGLA